MDGWEETFFWFESLCGPAAFSQELPPQDTGCSPHTGQHSELRPDSPLFSSPDHGTRLLSQLLNGTRVAAFHCIALWTLSMLGSSGQLCGLPTSPYEHKSAPTQARLGHTAVLPVRDIAVLRGHRVSGSSSQQSPHTPPKGFESKSAEDGGSPTAAPRAPSPIFMPLSSHFPLIPATSPYGSFPSPIRESEAQSPVSWGSPFSP